MATTAVGDQGLVTRSQISNAGTLRMPLFEVPAAFRFPHVLKDKTLCVELERVAYTLFLPAEEKLLDAKLVVVLIGV